MTTDQILAQLGAIRAICDALAAALIEDSHPSATSSDGCEHPEALRKPASTLRGPARFFCGQCKQIVDEATGEVVRE